MSASVSSASNNISEVVERLRRLTRWDAQSGWRYYDSDLAVVHGVNICNWPVAELNHKGHLAWPAGKQVFYLGQKFVVPANLSAYPVTGWRLLLSLTWWADNVQIFVNGELVGVGDLFDCTVRLLLSPSVLLGDEFLVILRLVSPGHDAGALVKSVCLYEAADSACFDPGFVADELEILQNSLSGNFLNLNSQYSPTKNIVDGGLVVKGEMLKSQVELAVGLIDWSVVGDRQKFDRSLSSLRQNLLGFLGCFQDGLKVETAEGTEGTEGGGRERVFGRAESDESTSIYIGESRGKSSIYKGKIYLVGHAHLDLAWLWPVAETWEAAERTFESALKLQSEFPGLIFCHSTPALYAWIEEHRPDLFAEIRKQVAAGFWEVVGGMWVEPDLNLISAESMVRQVVYGQRYAQEKFGELMRVVWLPDTFGFGWQLPQILRDGGVDYFVTQKLRWNDTTEFPYGAFWWEGLDGTKIFSMMSGPIGENIESVKMANHLFDWQIKTGLQSAVWLPGVGDHGGGPTRDMLEVAKRWELSPFFPRLEFAKAVDYLALIESQFSPEVSESQADVSMRDNSAAAESANLGKTSLSPVDVSMGDNAAILKQGESGNSAVAESANLSENFESQADVSMGDNAAILKQGESGNSAAAESANLGETSLSQADVSMGDNAAILKQGESGNSAVAESANLGENSEFQADVSMRDNSAVAESANLGKTSEFQADVSMRDNSAVAESANLGETSLSSVDVSMGENPPILKQGESGNSAVAESANLGETSLSPVDVSMGENPAILKQAEISNSAAVESANLGKNSEFPVDVSMRDNSAVAESANLGKASQSQADVSMGENPAILKQAEISNSAAVESANLGKNSEFPVDVSMRDNSAVAESANLAKTSEFLVDVSIGENQPILKQAEIGNSAVVESANLGKTSQSQADVSMRDNSAVVESANLGKTSQSQANVSRLPLLPLWKDELYLEFHRGCYTTHADQKRYNRRCEELLYQAELLSSLATICAGAIYPKSELEIAWKKVLFNQFHDILPGSSIAQVYADANLGWAEVDRTCRSIVLTSLDAIASQISLPSPPQPDAQPILIFNSLNWSRSEVVSLSLPDSAATTWAIYDLSGQRLTTQIQPCDRPQPQSTLLFLANNLPPVGYRVFWLCPEAAETLENSSPLPENYNQTWLGEVTTNIARNEGVCQETPFVPPIMLLENEFIRVKVDSETGNLSSIWDKLNHREVLNESGGNQLQSFQDGGQYWDAWNIDPNYAKYPLAAPILKDITWISQGEIRQSLRVVRQIGKSEFYQDYIVEIGSPVLKIKTVVDWQEKHVLVKAAFGLNVEADLATCEIPGGAIERTTKPQTAAEKAKWEVPILRWTDISNDDFGVSLLNDCKYGCDLQPNQIRLTLLRSSTWPDEQADIGIHEFTCGVYPHRGNWQDAGTVRQGYELNLPLLVKVFPKLEGNHYRTLPTVGKFLDLSADNLVLMAFKQSEDHANLWILRCYESQGKEARLELESDLSLAIIQSVDLLEKPANLPEKSEDGKGFQISPWKIASFSIAYGDNK